MTVGQLLAQDAILPSHFRQIGAGILPRPVCWRSMIHSRPAEVPDS
jgi:hypothetical protein